MTYHLLISDPLSESGLDILRNNPDISVDEKTDLSHSELKEIISRYDGLIVRSGTQVNADLLESAKQLKIIGRAGVGVDNIDLEAATKAGVLVVNAPDGNTISAAEHTFAMMMAIARKIPHAYLSLKNKQWDRKTFKGVELFQKTLGIIGLGRIGIEVAKRAKAFQMKVLAYDPFLTDEKAKRLGIERSDLDTIYVNADFITVHTPLTKDTRHLINDTALKKMKPGVRLINCARGGIIDEHALYQAIVSGHVAGAALDVFEEEPPMAHPLLELPEVIATPHLGASTVEAQEKVARDVSIDVLRVLRNEPAHHALNLPAIPDDVRETLMPYFGLGEKLGETAGQLLDETPAEVEITYSGELNDLETAPLTRSILKGILSRYLNDHINIINVKHYIKETGLTYNVKRQQHSQGFVGLVKVTLYSKDDQRTVSGALLNGYGARIVHIDDFSVDLPTEGHMIYIQHHDLPGLIGSVGTLLGEHGVNIGSMQVGRKSIGGNAIMVLTVDKHVDDELLSKIHSISHIKKVKRIDL